MRNRWEVLLNDDFGNHGGLPQRLAVIESTFYQLLTAHHSSQFDREEIE
jgi:hypothetical protein